MPLKPEQTQNVHLMDMLLSARKATAYVKDKTFEEFWDDERTRDAVAMRLTVIGEAATHINAETAAALPKVPFPQIRGLRNRIAHDYGRVNFKIVWEIVTRELPSLIAELEPFLQRQRKEQRLTEENPTARQRAPRPKPPTQGPARGI